MAEQDNAQQYLARRAGLGDATMRSTRFSAHDAPLPLPHAPAPIYFPRLELLTPLPANELATACISAASLQSRTNAHSTAAARVSCSSAGAASRQNLHVLSIMAWAYLTTTSSMHVAHHTCEGESAAAAPISPVSSETTVGLRFAQGGPCSARYDVGVPLAPGRRCFAGRFALPPREGVHVRRRRLGLGGIDRCAFSVRDVRATRLNLAPSNARSTTRGSAVKSREAAGRGECCEFTVQKNVAAEVWGMTMRSQCRSWRRGK